MSATMAEAVAYRAGHQAGRAEALKGCRCDSLRAVLADRERELLELKGPCGTCPLHYAHSGPFAPPKETP